MKRMTRTLPALALTLIALIALLALLALSACSERNLAELDIAGNEVDPDVFIDAFGSNLDYAAFEGSYYDALAIDGENGVDGSAALHYTIPLGNWAGGSYYTRVERDLSSFNALVLDAKASRPLELNSLGFGIGIQTEPVYQGEINNTPLSQIWSQVVIPIPNPSRLTAEKGLFWMSEAEDGAAVDVWFDNVRYAQVPTITNPRPVMDNATVTALLGETVTINGTATTFSVDGADVTVRHTAAHFDYISSDEAVLTAENGVVTAVGGGTATVTALLNGVHVDGEVSVTVIAPPSEPAPAPTLPATDVLALYSNAYTGATTVDTWRAPWSSASVAVHDQQIAGDDVKAYTGLTNNAYVGIEFTGDPMDAEGAGMTHFHVDFYAPGGSVLTFKLVDFGADGAYGGGDDSEYALTLHGGSDPRFATGEWVAVDVPLADFAGMNFGHVAQLILQSVNVGDVWIDNIYFHK
ncbi:hypothetical protein CSB20_14230 [bacterium DOLZORAL124_64_63]|nr:MAG: hypothetical protein CSB20_14230 [bacterium DOLZORAL124_64_63]